MQATMEQPTKQITRNEATQLTRDLLNEHGLTDWHVRLTTDLTKPFLGLCSYEDKSIILNAHHIDTHPTAEVINTIRHEVAHALTPGESHNEVWAAKARELGCDNVLPCAHYGFSPEVIDAIRSGADVVVTFEEHTVRTPKYQISRLQDKCKVCGKVIKQKSSKEFTSNGKRFKRIDYECGHFAIVNADSQTLFENFITFEHRANGCSHQWNKNECALCGANRPYPFQVDGMRALERANGRLAIFDEMGLGKTIQSLGWIAFHDESLPVLAIVKSGIKYQWLSQLVKWCGDKYFAQVLTSSKSSLLPGLKVYIVSYDLLRNFDLEKFVKAGIKTVILDECQQIKNPDSSRTQAVRKIVKNATHVIPLSGTPWKNRGSEFFTVLNMLDPKRFWSFKSFQNQWVDYYWDGNKYREGGIRRPEEFKKYIADLAIRRERTEVLPELPTISRNKFVCEVPEHARKAYQQAEDELVAGWNSHVIDGTEDSMEAQQQMMQNLIVMRQIVGVSKVPATLELIQEFLEDTDRKLVVFVHHKACGKMLVDKMNAWCIENGIMQPLVLSADLNSQERFTVQETFNNDAKARLLIASTLASGEGLNLQSCSDCIMHERQWNPANEEQAEGRFIRIGQLANAVTATYVHGNETIDTILDGLVERKRLQFHKTMNKGEMPIWNEAGLMKELVNSIVSLRRK